MRKPRKKPVHPYLIALGTEIKRLRVQRKLSLEGLGTEIGLDGANMQKIENGQNLTLSTLLKLAICLKVSPSKIIDRIPWELSEKDLDDLTNPRTVRRSRTKR